MTRLGVSPIGQHVFSRSSKTYPHAMQDYLHHNAMQALQPTGRSPQQHPLLRNPAHHTIPHSFPTTLLYITLPRPLEKEPHNKNLQPGHRNHQKHLHNRKLKDPLLSRPDGAKIAVLACSEVLLLAVDGGELGGELEEGFFERGLLVGCAACFAG
jgi:hypothetical protein